MTQLVNIKPAYVDSRLDSCQEALGRWKNAVIMGGMVGFSLLLSILFVMDRLASAVGDRLAASDPTAVDSADQEASDAVAQKPTPATVAGGLFLRHRVLKAIAFLASPSESAYPQKNLPA